MYAFDLMEKNELNDRSILFSVSISQKQNISSFLLYFGDGSFEKTITCAVRWLIQNIYRVCCTFQLYFRYVYKITFKFSKRVCLIIVKLSKFSKICEIIVKFSEQVNKIISKFSK